MAVGCVVLFGPTAGVALWRGSKAVANRLVLSSFRLEQPSRTPSGLAVLPDAGAGAVPLPTGRHMGRRTRTVSRVRCVPPACRERPARPRMRAERRGQPVGHSAAGGKPSARTYPTTGPTMAGQRTTTPRRGLCAEFLAHVQVATQPDTRCPGSRVVRSDVAVAHRPQRISPKPAVPPVRPRDLNQYRESGGDELLLAVGRLDLGLLVRQ